MNFYFAPTGPAMLCQPLNEAAIILLGRIEISVKEWTPILVPPAVHQKRVFPAPSLETLLLDATAGVLSRRVRTDRRLKMVGQGDDQVRRPRAFRTAHRPLPDVSWEPACRVRHLVPLHSHPPPLFLFCQPLSVLYRFLIYGL